MIEIYSKVRPELLLHKIFRTDDFCGGRQDIIPSIEFLQCAALDMDAGTTFRPHYHKWKDGEPLVIAQEGWVVMRGAVRVTFYDTDNTIIYESEMKAGDASFTLHGGHTYLVLEDGTLVYEFKTGPYEGQKLDKEFI